jgi:flagellar motility protein MotE (MotC chaperone)
MSGKMRLLMIAGMGLLSFAGFFALSVLTQPTEVTPEQLKTKQGQAVQGMQRALASAAIGKLETLSPKERVLDQLIKEMRTEITAYEQRKRELTLLEKRTQLAQEALRRQVQELENLRIEVASALTPLKEERAKLQRERIRIHREEAANLKRVALVYEKMIPQAAAATIERMMTNQQERDAVRILHYMQERSAAKVLGEITDPAVSARLSEMMKRIREE